jgi:hypothetical protein
MRKSSLLFLGVVVCCVIPVNAPTARPVESDGGPAGNSAALDSSLPLQSPPKLHTVSIASTEAGRLPSVNANVGRTAAVASKTMVP